MGYEHTFHKIKREIAKVVVGQDKIVDSLLRGIIAKGHILVEGVPGIAKTLVIRALATTLGCKSKRIQFTVDMLPTDITGIITYDKVKGFDVVKGPIFTNFLIADEINRAPPKTQSALLEAMQEKQTTIGRKTYSMHSPFFVMATENPIESSGTYPLPEAQIDRFLFKLNMGYPSEEESREIIERNITLNKFEDFNLKPITSDKMILEMQQATQQIKHSDKIKNYIVRISAATHKPEAYGIKLGEYIEYGCSPRASIGLFIAAKADALLRGDAVIKPQHIKNIAHDVLRHRILLNYRGQAEGIKTDKLIDEILAKVPIP